MSFFRLTISLTSRCLFKLCLSLGIAFFIFSNYIQPTNQKWWSQIKFYSGTNQSLQVNSVVSEDGTQTCETRYCKSTTFNRANNLPRTSLPYHLTNFSKNFWMSIQPSIECPSGLLQRLGAIYDGGKWVCGINHLKNVSSFCTFYSFGVNGDSSFEADMFRVNRNCLLFAYDPTVMTIGAPLAPSNPRVKFQRLGLSGSNVTVQGMRMQTLKAIMEQNGHDWIDILKVDIESGEYNAFNKILTDFDGPLPFGQLQIEFHGAGINKTNTTLDMIEQLQDRGLRLFYKEPNLIYPSCCGEYAFLNVHSLHLFLDEENLSKLVNVNQV